MYCQPDFSYQMTTDYQQYAPVGPYQPSNIQQYHGNLQYSPTNPPDRPSPSFRIEDILLQSKAGNAAAYGGGAYPGQHYTSYSALQHNCIGERDYQGNIYFKKFFSFQLYLFGINSK